MQLDELMHALPAASLHGDGSANISAITCDSRCVRAGSLFAAVSGVHEEGARYIAAAIEQGAAAILTASQRPGVSIPQIISANPRIALAHLANHFHGRPAEKIKTIGITGTNGKSTTAWLLRHVLNALGHSTGMLGTIIYDTIAQQTPAPLTTPESTGIAAHLATMVAAEGDYAVLEASSHSLCQSRLAAQEFTAAVFTNLTRDHLDYHADMAAYLTAKKILFDSLTTSAVAIINQDDPASAEIVSTTAARMIRFGMTTENAPDVRGDILTNTLFGAEILIRIDEREYLCNSPLVGRFNVQNVLAAIATIHGLGLDVAKAVAAVAHFSGIPGRLERFAQRGRTVFVDYAHTDAALRGALSVLRPLCAGRLIVVFGCGGDRDRGKRPLMGQAAEEIADTIYITNDNPRSEDPAAIAVDILAGLTRPDDARVMLDRRAAIQHAVAHAELGDVVLVAGKGHEDYQIVGEQRLAMDDRDMVQTALAQNEREAIS